MAEAALVRNYDELPDTRFRCGMCATLHLGSLYDVAGGMPPPRCCGRRMEVEATMVPLDHFIATLARLFQRRRA